MKSREISRSKIGPFSLACTDPYIGIGWEYQSTVIIDIIVGKSHNRTEPNRTYGNYRTNPNESMQIDGQWRWSIPGFSAVTGSLKNLCGKWTTNLLNKR